MPDPLAAPRDRLPEVVGERVEVIFDGWDSEVHVVDGAWVVRVPRRPQVAADVRAERARALQRFSAAGVRDRLF